ncbi:Activating signal cointegrator 1 complex subunit 3 [Halotydeus destructor]|nr:Activating signal cointegrator 1 complex subunit 3 [Halotydeus destructor]
MAFLKSTDWMRLHMNVSRPTGSEDEASNGEYLRLLRQRLLKHAGENDLSDFKELRNSLKELAPCHSITDKEINDRLRELLGVSEKMLGIPGADQQMSVETGAMFMLQMFHDSIYSNGFFGTNSDQRNQLCTVFDPVCVTSELINRSYEQCRFLLKVLEGSLDIGFLFTPQAKNSRESFGFGNIEEPDPMLEVQWGLVVDKSPFDLKLLDSSELDLKLLDWNSLTTARRREINFDFSYRQETVPVRREETQNGHSSLDVSWLYTKLKNALKMNGLVDVDSNQFYENLKSMLESHKSDQEIEEDLLGFLGMSNVIFVREVISSRKSLISAFKMLYSEPIAPTTNGMKFQLPSVKPVINVLDRRKQQCAIGQSIVVQTEEEKQMQKLLRKVEKKAAKEYSKEQKQEGNRIGFTDFERMKYEREQALINAMYAPLFQQENSEKDVSKPIQYEYVFDSYSEAKQSAAFVSGHKIILPEGFSRKDDKKWEEVSIPASAKPQANIIERFPLISVSTLDEIGQKCFAGIERLNQIQSIVFNTAYNTMENMLVCAPTGAGKTNIAMLTVAKVIKDHSSAEGSVRKDKFKIIYVAPMKALASEMTDSFSRRLKPFNIKVRELTGDMQLTRQEIIDTQMIVTTPEKWDVVTRKSSEDTNAHLIRLVRLLIIDEVHLLQSDRGPVLEALVARTIRHVEASQQMTRIIGLSATLPSYVDVALFLGVSLNKGMFFFDNRFRPVPLELAFVGCKAMQSGQQRADMDEVCYDKVKTKVEDGHQVMVFVHSRNATHKLAQWLRDESCKQGQSLIFAQDSDGPELSKAVNKTRNKALRELLPCGFAIHHAGMLRQDRNLVEKTFRDGFVKVLVCTSTLAWGVNLPAHAVVIRGTEVYDSARGEFVDVSMLDVMQIFGRAGRPQYDTSGFACILTSHDKLSHYLSMLTHQYPIESNFEKYLADNLNAEIVSRTVTTVDEAVEWLNYTYLVVRMQREPLAYGLRKTDLQEDPTLINHRRKLVMNAVAKLICAKMIKYDEESEELDATDLGHTASFYYIKYVTIEIFNDQIREDLENDAIMSMICHAQEFDQLRVREEEINELMDLKKRACRLKVPGGVDTTLGKVNILLQSYLSNYRLESFSLISDSMYVVQNIVRMARGLFDYTIKSGWAHLAHKLLILSKMFEVQMWEHQSPVRQFHAKELDYDTLRYLDTNSSLSAENLRDDGFTSKDIGHLVRNQTKGPLIKKYAHMLPWLQVTSYAQPVAKTYLRKGVDGREKEITMSAVKVFLEIKPDFTWNDQYHGRTQIFWIWIQEHDATRIKHYEQLVLTKKQVVEKEVRKMKFHFPASFSDGRALQVPSHYILHVDSDRWLGCDIDEDVICKELIEEHGE